MVQEAGGPDKQKLEEALRDALKSVLGGTGPGVNPRVEFYNKFQREMEEHDRDFEKKYDEDLNTTLIFSGLFSAVTSAFIIDIQSELKPDYQELNNTLLEMLLNATTGTLPVGSAISLPRWPGPDPVIVQVQCIFYATLSATLLASFLAMLGKQWLNRYRQSETNGSSVDRSRMRERKLTGIETWKFYVVMEFLPLILQGALVLLGFALSRYLWELNRSASSVVIGFTCFGFLFYLLIATASVFSFDCPFQTPLSLLIRFVIGLATPHWRRLRRAFGPEYQPPELGTLVARYHPPVRTNNVGRGRELEASITALACITPAVVRFPWSVTPLFSQESRAEGDKLDARCTTRMFGMSTDADVITSIMDFIPEIIWHNGIKDVPLKCIYNILMDCFDFSGPHPVVVPKLRDVAYLSARAFTHIELQRRCITWFEEYKQDSWKVLCANHPLLSPADYDHDSDLKAVLFTVDMTLGYNNGFPWEQTRMTLSLRAWMSHVFLYRAWHEGQLSEVVMDFVENSMSLTPSSDIVITDCLFIIGLMVGVPLHVNDITVRDKSREKKSMLRKVFRALSAIFSSRSRSIQTPSALRALQLVTRLAVSDVSNASYELFKKVMASDDLTDQHWEAARLAIHGAFQDNAEDTPPTVGEPKELLKFLGYHLGLQGAGEDHGSSINFALDAIIIRSSGYRADPLTVEWISNFNHAGPSFANGMRSIMHPDNTLNLRLAATGLMGITSDQWFDPTVPIVESEGMSEFCEHLATFIIDDAPNGRFIQMCGVAVLFGMLRSPEWRKHIVTRLWSLLAYCTQIEEDKESFRWCLRNAIELLEFTRGLPDGEGMKWWYGTLWFHYDKLGTTARDEVEKIAEDMSLGDGILDLGLYLNLIGQEIARTRQEVDQLRSGKRSARFGMELRSRLIALERNHRRLARITGGR